MKQKLNFILRYFNYLLFAKSRYYLHSPFVYKFMMDVVLDDRNFYAFEEIENLRDKLLADKTKIEVKDFGAGSKVMKSNKRKISKITKYAATSYKKGTLLFKIINYYKIKNVLEFGTSMGIGTLYFAKANSKVKVTTMEGCPQTANKAKANFKTLKANNIEVLNDEFEKILPQILNKKEKPELIFFDGNHTKKATLNYFKKCLPTLSANSIFVFDDINWSDEMFEAWNEIKVHPKVSLSINLFQLGVLFFKEDRNEQEHFKLYF